MDRLIPSILAIGALLLVLSLSIFTVDQRQYAIVFQFGEMIGEPIKAPGIHFKVPLLQNVRYFDNRIQTIDAEAPELFNTREKKNVLVDSFVKWRILDVKKFYTSVGSEDRAVARLKQTINDGLRAEFGQKNVADVISGKRDEVMDTVRKRANKDAGEIGVQVLDVRLKRVDFPKDISNSVYERMQSERRTVASQLRSEGAADGERIRAEADKQREVILAEAYRKAQELKGEGDGKAAAIYASAFGKNPEFYAFWRSMDVYKDSFKNKSDVMVLDPSSDFFKYFKNPQAGAGGAKAK